MALDRTMYHLEMPVRGPILWSALLLVGPTALSGCADPGGAVGFEEYHSDARVRAIQRAAASNDQSAVPKLIARLESDDAAERLFAIRALERLTGSTLGFDHAGTRSEREEAVERWRAWHARTSPSNADSTRGADRP